MRVSREKAAENRQKIIETAARLFRERGFDGVGVDTIMEGAGLTHGGFYGHFKSKDDLAAEAIVHALVLGGAYQDRFTTLEDFVGDYLSEPHRTALGSGCAVAALSGDIVRQNAKLRSGLAAHLRRQFERVTRFFAKGSAEQKRQRAIATIAGMVGALVLARAVDDQELANEILGAARNAFGNDATA
jgi:TetR/AcrR family transcriptional regulator, transcriptional repressor for nem operon